MPKAFYLLLLSLLMAKPARKPEIPDSKLAVNVRTKVWPRLQKELDSRGLKFNYPIYLRVFKETSVLEVWIRSGPQYQFFKSYNVCYFSGGLGTKTKTGDNKSPEGFYTLKPNQLFPFSSYYLAMNIGYPNKLETLKGYTGDAIMMHGHCASIGCYAMGDSGIEEIYTLVYKAFTSGQQQINLDIFPFRMDEKHMNSYKSDPCIAFWKTMKPGYDLFEKNHIPQLASIKNKEYSFAK